MSMMVCILGSNKEERAPEAEDGVNETKEEVVKCKIIARPTSLQKHEFCVFLVQEETVDQTNKQKNSFTIVFFS